MCVCVCVCVCVCACAHACGVCVRDANRLLYCFRGYLNTIAPRFRELSKGKGEFL